MASVKDITSLMRDPSPEDTALVEKAFKFAEEAHKDHKRFSGEPYFNHLYETAKSIAHLGFGPRTIAASLLHDSIEDVGIAPETIKNYFGERVLFLVEGVTKLGQLKYHGLERHTESLRKLLVATSQDVRVLIIKLMDRLHNMKTLEHVPEDKRKRIALETLEIYAPIAHRLGMGVLRRELEDLSFPYVYPKEATETKKLLTERAEILQGKLEKVLRTLKKEMAENGITRFSTDYRVKGLFSLYRKLRRKDDDIEKIYDIMALRIVVRSVEDCYRVLGLVHASWRPLPNKIKDYIAFPKPNGYQSLHTTVFTGDGSIIEIQIRTEKMHREAEYGIASHVLYKETGGSPERARQLGLEWLKSFFPFRTAHTVRTERRTERKGGKEPAEGAAADASIRASAEKAEKYDISGIPSWVRQMSYIEGEEMEQKDFLKRLKTDFFSRRVFVFTPKGDVVDLPVGASPIDFAYAIHSDIGDHMAGAKVNGKMVTLATELHNGDIVEILTREAAHPSQKWLEFAKTTMAQKHIRATLARSMETAEKDTEKDKKKDKKGKGKRR